MAAVTAVCAAAAAGCGGASAGSSASAGAATPASGGAGGAAGGGAGAAQTVAVTVTAAGCAARPASVPAGPVVFNVRNTNADDVDEIELAKTGDEDILASRENLKPGATRVFALRLAAGSYSLNCEGATNGTGPLTVTGSATEPTLTPAQKAIADSYHTYALGQADQLITKTKTFTDAIRAGNMAAAMDAYGPAHMIYENIEFIGDHVDDGRLDTAIDAREAAAQESPGGLAAWTGFHRIEKLLWGQHTMTGGAALATRLDADLVTFRRLLFSHSFTPAELANGAGASIDESLDVHLPAAEDHYSGTSLWDVAGKVESAREIFSLLSPGLAQSDTGVNDQVSAALTNLTGQLTALRPGGRFVNYATVDGPKRQTMINTAIQLDDALSRMPGLVV
jgi:iron uptake system component EfeO